MIPLPSGKIAGISNIRARYHALRLNRSVNKKTPYRELYGLVDIVTSPKNHQQLPYHNTPRYLFTGHTLADFPAINNWTHDDRCVFSGWLQQESQVRIIEQVKSRIVSEELPLVEQSYAYPEHLYSSLIRRIEALPMQRASAEQWRKTLFNMKRQGIREEEMNWSGLLPLLSGDKQYQSVTISKQELLAKIDFSAIRLSLTHELVTEKHCDLDFVEIAQFSLEGTTLSAHRLIEEDEIGILRYVDPMHFYKVCYIKQIKPNSRRKLKERWFALDTIGQAIINTDSDDPCFMTKEEAFNAASQHALRHVGVPVDHTPCKGYEHKTLCGGGNYREWLLTLPDYPISHFTSHYHARNLLLHFRTKERIDLQGRRLLFIEEIQSDWHQLGAMLGYQNRWPGQIPPAPFRKEWIGLALKLLLLHAANSDVEAIAWTQGIIQESHYQKRLEPVRRLYDSEIPRYLKRLCKPWKASVEFSKILTKEPRLQISRQKDKWFITDSQGGFYTRPRHSQQEAIKVMARHCKQIVLEVPALFLTQRMKEDISNNGFPLFGE